ncbi:cation:proton antiporter domain-containing protein [Aerococcus urinae]
MTSANKSRRASAFLLEKKRSRKMLLLSFAYIFIIGLLVERLCQSLRIPSLVGYLFLGILLGPYALNLLDPTILDLSADLRQVALIIILTRAGLSLDIMAFCVSKNGANEEPLAPINTKYYRTFFYWIENKVNFDSLNSHF